VKGDKWDMNLSRHISVFNPANVLEQVHIIGAGATGSFVAQMLVRMGVAVINIYDFDKVEIHNIPNQSFDTRHLEKSKVEALASILKDINPDVVVNIFDKEVKEEDIAQLEGYVFMLIDSMKARKTLWEACKANDKIIHYWESRLGSDQARVYSIALEKGKDYRRYEQDFYDDDKAEVSACGTSITVLPIVLQTASLMIVQFIDLVMKNDTDTYFKTIFDNHYNKFEEDWVVAKPTVEKQTEVIAESFF
jgi:molybdopterin/thiamine biosynthesis adenylyltransferase